MTWLGATGAEAKTRNYDIQAEDVTWDFAPTGQDLLRGGPVPEPWTNSHVFEKTRYIVCARLRRRERDHVPGRRLGPRVIQSRPRREASPNASRAADPRWTLHRTSS